ncbi:MAG: FAD:protein FMN transferase [Candidatus Hydrogenedentes bacterium]|nr:FAD:protein FMN transferase [Candidatus Hydrogenedentota bacterium]
MRPKYTRLTREGVIGATLSLLLCILLFLSSCGPPEPKPQIISFTGQTMGTTYTVKVMAMSMRPVEKGEVERAIEAELEAVNQKMSTYRPDSELSRFNASTDATPFSVSAETAEVFRQALEISRISGGAFDITVGPIVNAWGFGPEKAREGGPTEEELAVLRQRVGYRKIEVDVEAKTVRKTQPDVYCDLSAIAKGYGVDEVAGALEHDGFHDYMVEVGGEVRASGHNAEGAPWQIAIEKPDEQGRSVQLVVPLENRALATSGDYRNYFEKHGVRYSHEIDPSTGRPITHNLASVSVIHRECSWADGFATALIVLGPEKGYNLAVEQNLAAYFIVREKDGGFTERSTPAFEEILKSAQGGRG